MNGLRWVRSGGLPAANEASSLVLRSPQPSACCLTLKPGNLRSNSAMDVSWIVLTVCGSTSVCQTFSSRTCWPSATGALASRAAPAATPVEARNRRRERRCADRVIGSAPLVGAESRVGAARLSTPWGSGRPQIEKARARAREGGEALERAVQAARLRARLRVVGGLVFAGPLVDDDLRVLRAD